MVGRVLELSVIPEKMNEFNNRLDSEVLPILRSQAGFVDALCLHSNQETGRVVGISLWNTADDLARYDRETFPRIAQGLQPVLRGEPRMHTYNVDLSTVHKITTAKKAA